MLRTTADLLTVDCGNSTIDCLRHGDGARLRLATAAPDLAALGGLLGGGVLQRCVAVSVVPRALDAVASTLTAAGIAVRRAGADLPCPLPLAYDTPATLGADRWVGAFAAHRRHGRSIVVDCGSATTVNLVDAD